MLIQFMSIKKENVKMNTIKDSATRASLWRDFFLTVVMFLFSLLPAIAQSESGIRKRLRHEFSVGIGYGLLMSLNEWSDKDDKWRLPSVHLQYLYNLNRYVGVGLMTDYACSSWGKINREILFRFNENNRFVGGYIKETEEKESTTWITFSPTIRVYWFHRSHVSMYSRMSLGVLTANGHNSGVYLMSTFSPIAIEAGGERLRFCSEPLSIGTLGIINAGLKYSF